MTRDELSTTVKDLKELRTLQDRITVKIKALEDALKEHMADTDTFTLTGEDYSVSWNEVSSTRLDTTALKHDLPDIAAQYMKTNITRRFIVN
jgi:predicted phage-related endonuclease